MGRLSTTECTHPTHLEYDTIDKPSFELKLGHSVSFTHIGSDQAPWIKFPPMSQPNSNKQ